MPSSGLSFWGRNLPHRRLSSRVRGHPQLVKIHTKRIILRDQVADFFGLQNLSKGLKLSEEPITKKDDFNSIMLDLGRERHSIQDHQSHADQAVF